MQRCCGHHHSFVVSTFHSGSSVLIHDPMVAAVAFVGFGCRTSFV